MLRTTDVIGRGKKVRVIFPGGIEWAAAELDGMVAVEDVIDNGLSQKEITGLGPALLLMPRPEVEAAGGQFMDRT